MKRLFVPFLTLATLFFLGSSAYAQGRGRPPVTPAGGASSTHENRTSPSSPGVVLSRNPKVGPALTEALAKKGITLPGGQKLADFCTTNHFRTLGQCIAALHINHKFPGCTITELSTAKSLGKAIQGCNPQADAKTEARDATKQANQEIKESGS